MTSYKQTELGLIPSDWEVLQLNSVGNIVTGSTPSTIKSEFWNGEIAWVTPTDISKYKDIYYSERQITEEGLKSIRELPENTLLVTCIASIGKNTILRKRGACNQQINAVIPYEKFNVDFLYYYFENKKNALKCLAGITATPIISKALFSTFLIIAPCKLEQTAIATALSDTDALLAELEKLLAKKQAIKTATMQQLLTGKTRLPEFAHRADGTPKGSLKTEWGDIPEDWEVVELGDICHYKNGMALEYLFNKYDGYNVISIGNYSLNSKYLGNDTYISKTYKYQINKFIVKKDELTMILNDKTSSGEIIGRVLLIEEDDKYVINQRSLILAPKKHLSKYLYYYLNSDYCRRMVFKEAKPGTQIYINTGDVLGLKIIISKSTTEQTAIAQILGDMDSEITALQARIEKLRKIKQGMMQNLLTGKIRLPC